MKIRPVILSGGSGTRLWPVSRAKAPKQFVPLIGTENLFTETVRSSTDGAVFAAPIIVGNEAHKYLIQDSLDAAKVKAEKIILEPIGRNTAAAALCAALVETDTHVLHMVRPSDHLIADRKAWVEALTSAVPAAASGSLVLFGIKPDYAETGYGYILSGAPTKFAGVNAIASFKEKPEADVAEALLKQGALWNSGIFLYSPAALIKEAEKLAPDMLRQVKDVLAKAKEEERGLLLDQVLYETIPSEPFDRVFMERTTMGAVVPCSIGWNDVGAWQAMWLTSPKDIAGNATSGMVVAVDTKNSYIHSEGPTVAVFGMTDVAVIATKDAVLVTPRARTSDVKILVSAVEQSEPNLAQEHSVARRPWGTFETIARGTHYQVKRITVLPGRSLSLQMHHHRAEHWIVVVGTAKTECDGVEKMVFPNESIYIPKGSTHRLTNPGVVDLHLIEVQSGDYLGEDDIVRFADNYGRST